jgi:hypothetical protein
MATEFCAHAIEWWLRGQSKFEGSSVRTQQTENGLFDIVEWRVDGVAKPSDAEVTQIVNDYKAYLVTKKSQDSSKVDLILQKIGLTKLEFKELCDLIK